MEEEEEEKEEGKGNREVSKMITRVQLPHLPEGRLEGRLEGMGEEALEERREAEP